MTTRDSYIYSLLYGNAFIHKDGSISDGWLVASPHTNESKLVLESPTAGELPISSSGNIDPQQQKVNAEEAVDVLSISSKIHDSNMYSWAIVSDYDLLNNVDNQVRELIHKMLQAIKIDTNQDCLNLTIYTSEHSTAELVSKNKDLIRKNIITELARHQVQMIIVFGGLAAKVLFGEDRALNKLRNTVHHLDVYPCVVTFAPRDLLELPIHKAEAWQDLQLARDYHNKS